MNKFDKEAEVTTLTVQELIDKLMVIEDKSMEVKVGYESTDQLAEGASVEEEWRELVHERLKTDGKPVPKYFVIWCL